MDARVADLSLRPATFIDGMDSFQRAGARMRESNCYALFVRDDERTGVLTRSDLVNAAIVKRQPIDSPVGPLANHPVVSVALDDFVSTALLRMTKHNKRRVAVVRGGEFVGVLEDIDLLSFLAGNSQLVAQRIDRSLVRRRPGSGGANY